MRIFRPHFLVWISCLVLTAATPAVLQASLVKADPRGMLNVGQKKPGKPRNLAPSIWKGIPDGAQTLTVEILISGQVAKVYADGELVGQSPVSTGRPGFGTPSGTYEIVEKDKDHYSSQYGSFVGAGGQFLGEANLGDTPPKGGSYEAAPMPYFLRLTWEGIGMHAGYIPGFPASHGCIRLPKDMAQKFYEALPVGTTVVVKD